MAEFENIQQELEHAREQQRLNIPAKRILEKIQGIPSDVEKLQRRWFWELLQNASDYNDEVSVELELYPDKVIFKHNGKPFRPIDTENLIAPDSGKDDKETRTEDTIGQFGTGFISTHVLSSHITVNGLLKSEQREEYHRFQFTLDRSGFTDKEILKHAITISSLESNKSLQLSNYTPGSFDTIFTYDLTKNLPGIKQGQSVSAGLEYIYEVLPYTLAFMPKVKKVTIYNRNTSFVNYSGRSFTPQLEGTQFSVLIKTKNDDNANIIEEKRFFELQTEGDATVIVRVADKKILPYPEKLTKLFCSLPMIGTENFSSPVAINSGKFVPKTERDGIKLSNVDVINRSIISSATKAYQNLINNLVAQDVDGFYNVANWTYYTGEDSEKKWYSDNVITPLKNHLSTSKVVRTANSRITLNELKIPYFTQEESKRVQPLDFYALCVSFMPELIPVEEDYIPWFRNIDFNVFKSCKFELKELLKQVEDLSNLSALKQKIKDAEAWLIKLIEFTLAIDENFLDQFKIIPNQLGDFVHRKDDINYDDSLDPNLIEIYDVLSGKEYRKLLLHKSFEGISNLLPSTKTKKELDLTKAIDDGFSSIPESERSGNKFQNGLKLMFKYIAECGKDEAELNSLFKWFSQKKPQLFIETIADDDRDKVLSIAQSGKLSSLSKLAESNLTTDELNTISSNVDEVVELAKILESVEGGMNKLLQYAEMIRKDDEDFKFKLEIGERVEKVFNEALLNAGITSNCTKVQHEGIGSHDFEIINSNNGKKFYIELKSYGKSSGSILHLAPSQAKFGSLHPDNYCLASIERPSSIDAVTEEYIKSKLVVRTNVEPLVSKGLEDYEKYNQIAQGNNLYLNLRDAIRINVNNNELASAAISFNQLVEKIKTNIQ
jgi:hypothetical protein